MKPTVLLSTVFLALAVVAHAAAQQPAQPMPAMPGMQAQPSGGKGMCGGMCPMMSGKAGGMKGGAAMPMMDGACGAEEPSAMAGMPMAGGPSESPRIVQLRGEMMKAMGDVLLKYGKMMEDADRR